MTGLKLNLGCGEKRFPGYVNVDKFGTPDLKHDLEKFPWPWPDNSVSEILLIHVLEHLGQQTFFFLGIIKEIYRVCQPDAQVHITVPHPRHDNFYNDPTHVRVITPELLGLFSQSANREWIAKGAANSPLGIYLNVNFEVVSTNIRPSALWFRLHPAYPVDVQFLLEQSALYNNLIEQYEMVVRVIK